MSTRMLLHRYTLLAYHKSLKQTVGNQYARGATKDQKTYNFDIYRQIYTLCPNKQEGPARFWAVKNNVDVVPFNDDAATETLHSLYPEALHGLKCFNMGVMTLKEPFNRTEADADGLTEHMKRPAPPSGLKFGRLRNSKALREEVNIPNVEVGIWKLCEVRFE